MQFPLKTVTVAWIAFFFSGSGDIRELFDTSIKLGHAAAFSEDCDSASSKGIARGAGNQV